MTDASELEKRHERLRRQGYRPQWDELAVDAIAYARQSEDRAREMKALLLESQASMECHTCCRCDECLDLLKRIDRASEGKR